VMLAAIILMILQPPSWKIFLPVAVLMTAVGLSGLGEVLDLGPVARARVAGLTLLMIGVTSATGAAIFLIVDPSELPDIYRFPRIGPTGRLVVCLIGAGVFGGVGAYAIARSGRAGGRPQ